MGDRVSLQASGDVETLLTGSIKLGYSIDLARSRRRFDCWGYYVVTRRRGQRFYGMCVRGAFF